MADLGEFTITIKNQRALKALLLAARIMHDAHTDQPWNTQFARAVRLLHYAAKHLGMQADESK